MSHDLQQALINQICEKANVKDETNIRSELASFNVNQLTLLLDYAENYAYISETFK
jgi:hypothetical protein